MENFLNLKKISPNNLNLGRYVFFIPEKSSGVISGGTLAGIETRKGETLSLKLISAGREITLCEGAMIFPEV